MRKHIVEMDVARALATIAVVMIHVTANPISANPRGGMASLAYLSLNIWSRFAVSGFVVLSGAGLSLSARPGQGYVQFLWRRLSKIVPAYLVWSVVYWAVFSHGWNPVKLFSDLLTGRAFYHLYFVPLIVLQYMLFPFLHRWMKSVAGLITCCLITLGALYFGFPKPLAFLAFAGNPLYWLFYMALGVWLAKPEVLDPLTSGRYRNAAVFAYVFCLAGMVGLARWMLLGGAAVETMLGITGLLMIPYTVVFFLAVFSLDGGGRSLGWLRWISVNSFAIYLAHPLVLSLYLVYVYQHIAILRHLYGVSSFIVAFGGASIMAAAGAWAKKLVLNRPRPA